MGQDVEMVYKVEGDPRPKVICEPFLNNSVVFG